MIHGHIFILSYCEQLMTAVHNMCRIYYCGPSLLKPVLPVFFH